MEDSSAKIIPVKDGKENQEGDSNQTEKDLSLPTDNENQTTILTIANTLIQQSSSFLSSKKLNIILIITVAVLLVGYHLGETTETSTIAEHIIATDDVMEEAGNEEGGSDILESVIVGTTTMALNLGAKLGAKLADKFMSVKIKKTDLDAAEKRLRGELIENWEEKV